MRVIEGSTYFDLVQYHPTHKFPNGITIAIIRQRYCRPMNLKGLCTGVCDNCAGSIRNINHKLRLATDVVSPAGLLSHIVRSEFANVSEMAYERDKAEVFVDILGEREDINPFDRLREELKT